MTRAVTLANIGSADAFTVDNVNIKTFVENKQYLNLVLLIFIILLILLID